jgi:hypothetical protein
VKTRRTRTRGGCDGAAVRLPPVGLLLLASAVLTAAGCRDAAHSTSPGPRVLSLAVEAGDRHHFATVHLELDREAAAEAEYWTQDGLRLRVASPPGARHEILLPRLRAGATYEFLVRTDGLGPGWLEAGAGEFDTPPLPGDLAELRFDASGDPTPPMVLLVANNAQSGGFTGYVAVDREGEVVWHLRVDGPSGIARRPDGNFVFSAGRGLAEVSPTGETVAEVPTDPDGRHFHHDLIATATGTVLAIARDTQTVEGTRVTGEAIWEWTPGTGELAKRWSSFDALDPHLDRGSRSRDDNWLHANALWLGTRGNVLVSSHFLNQIISVAPDFQALEWRMGGPNATITVDEEERFTGQHTVAEVEGGRILLFDNRHEQGDYSRAVEFELDGDRAHRVWEWRPERDNFASVISSARRLPGGSTLVAFGTSAGLAGASGPVEVYEVSPGGVVLWHLEVDGLFALYRAEPLFDIAGEAPVL